MGHQIVPVPPQYSGLAFCKAKVILQYGFTARYDKQPYPPDSCTPDHYSRHQLSAGKSPPWLC